MGVLNVVARPEKLFTGLAHFFIRHWLAILIVLTILFIIPIVGYPLMMASGDPTLQWIAGVVHLAYRATCHQLPQRSLFVEGYEMAVCSRCFAIYLAFLAGTVAFAFVRRKLKIWPLSWFVVLCVPMAIDGFAQLLGVPLPRALGPGGDLVWMVESTNGLRLITGAIFGLACALFILPYLAEIFDGDAALPAKKVTAPADNEQRPAPK